MSTMKEKTWWTEGVQAGWIETYEKEMIRFLEAQYGALHDDVKLSAVYCSLFSKAGHTCLPVNEKISTWAQIIGLDLSEIRHLPKGQIDRSVLPASPVVGAVVDMKPFVMHNDMLSFRKYKIQEDVLLQWFNRKDSKNHSIDIGDYIREIFPENDHTEGDWQKTAAVLSLIKPFLIISGGPGTGKTTTVARILVLQQRTSERPLKFALAAPTGKAAGRMGEALYQQLENMDLTDEELRHYPKEATTIHRLLRSVEEKGLLPPEEQKQLHYDLIIVDEASMVDLSLMHRLIRHLSPKTKLILLGDKDQLASVEAGSVFADLCQKKENGFCAETINRLREMGLKDELPVRNQSVLDDSIVYLTKSYRFGPDTGIGKLAEAVKSGGEDSAGLSALFDGFYDLQHRNFSYQKVDFDEMLKGLLGRVERAGTIDDPREMLRFWKESVWLSVLRRGLAGTERLNRLIEQQIAARRLAAMDNGWYHGRPVMVTKNDYNLGLFNGDLGVCMRDSAGELWLYAESGREFGKLKPGRIVNYQPAYFLTVHKSQGSEFEHVNLLLPRKDHQLLTRELIYTAITRAKRRFKLFGDLEIFSKGMHRETRRFTGLQLQVVDS